MSASLEAQTIVRGKVTDETGAGMPGVNIILRGTSIGTTTDGQGAYSIEVPDEQTVLARRSHTILKSMTAPANLTTGSPEALPSMTW
jgi:hypothetical protein